MEPVEPPAPPNSPESNADFELSERDFRPIPRHREPGRRLDKLTPGMLLGIGAMTTCLLSLVLLVPLLAMGAAVWYGYGFIRDAAPPAAVEEPAGSAK